MSTIIHSKISNLIQQQFPAYYRENGPVFVLFVTEYYKWLESITAKQIQTVDSTISSVTVKATNNVVVGTNTKFTSYFSNGDQISVYLDTDSQDYRIFTIDTVSNNSHLTLNTASPFSASKVKYGTVNNQINPLYFTRNFVDLTDVDTTLNQFIVYFKEKFLKNLQFDTATDVRTLIKHSLDLYRSKGTERSIDLLFKAVFGVPASVYYPSDDLFRLSDGKWYSARYLEFAPNEEIVKLTGKQIVGLTSGAVAFCEAVVRKIIKHKVVDVCFISSIKGTFQTGELVNSADSIIYPDKRPAIVGSLTSISVAAAGTGDGFSVGQTVAIQSNSGLGGIARVSSTTESFGTVDPTLIDGGYGYSANANVYISDTSVAISNLSTTSQTPTKPFPFLFSLLQPTANINYVNANGTLTNNSLIFTYHANNDLKGQGRILDVTTINSSAGEIKISVLSGNMQATAFYTTSNTIVANQSSTNGYNNTSANGRIIGTYSNVTLQVTQSVGTFQPGEEIYQLNNNLTQVCNGTFLNTVSTIGTNATIIISNVSTSFITGTRLIGRTSNAQANVQTFAVAVAVDQTNGTFISTQNNYVYVSNSSVNGTITTVYPGTGFSLAFSNNLNYTETINVNSDVIQPYLTIDLANNAFGFPGNTAANLTYGTIEDAWSFVPWTIGSIQYLTSINRGSSYTVAPIVRITDPLTAVYNKPDTLYIQYANSTTSYAVGELITQTSSGARGLVTANSNTTVLVVRNLRFNDSNNFVVTANANSRIVGQTSGAQANATLISANSVAIIGNNALIDLQVTISNSAISSVDVIDSGFGFVDNEQITLINSSNTQLSGNGVASVTTAGKAAGRYIRNGGAASSNKKLFDGYYWQHLSYEVRSSVILDKYADMLKQVVHVSGTQYFGALYDVSTQSFETTATSTITVE